MELTLTRARESAPASSTRSLGGGLDPERLAALAFAGSELVAEVDPSGRLLFAAGAFRNLFGADAASFVGRMLRDLVAPGEHEAVEAALGLLQARGRLFPFTVRLADRARTPLALAGIALGAEGRTRFYVSFARLPVATAKAAIVSSQRDLARLASARLREGGQCALSLIEVSGADGNTLAPPDVLGAALRDMSADGLASELAPGRFGIMESDGAAPDCGSLAAELEAALARHGLHGGVDAQRLSIGGDGLTPTQAVRALRQALDVFSRSGAAGLAQAGFSGGLQAYMDRVRGQTGLFRQAIRNGRFDILFQPIVALADRVPHHAEALIRPLPIPECAVESPQSFVSLIEGLGLADELDLAVAAAVCRSAERAAVPLAFNLSGQTVQGAACRERLVALLADQPARRAGRLMVEITETAEIEDVAEARRTVDALRDLGLPVCLDDFGAGTTDVRLLRALGPDVVKLDGSYVPGITQDGRERAIVAGMVEIARGAGAEVVAERVETDAEADALAALGVDYGQGWLFGRPAPLGPPSAPSSPVPGSRASRRRGDKEVWG